MLSPEETLIVSQLKHQIINEIEPRDTLTIIIQFMKALVAALENYVVVPHETGIDALAEQKIRRQLVYALLNYANKVKQTYTELLSSYDDITKRFVTNNNEPLFDMKFGLELVRKLDYLATGIKDPASFVWSIDNLKNILSHNVNFASELSALFIDNPLQDNHLKFLSEQSKQLRNKFRNAVSALIEKFYQIAEDAKLNSISADLCAKWIQNTMMEIANHVGSQHLQKELEEQFKAVLLLAPRNNPTINYAPGHAIAMTDFSQAKKSAIQLYKEASVTDEMICSIRSQVAQLQISDLEQAVTVTHDPIKFVVFDPLSDPTLKARGDRHKQQFNSPDENDKTHQNQIPHANVISIVDPSDKNQAIPSAAHPETAKVNADQNEERTTAVSISSTVKLTLLAPPKKLIESAQRASELNVETVPNTSQRNRGRLAPSSLNS